MVFKKTTFKYEIAVPFFGFIPDEIMPVWNFYTQNFYLSSYICPECGKLMMKTVFPNDYPFETNDGIKKVPRIFTCGDCKTLHIPAPGYKLSSNNGYYYKAKSDEEFEIIIKKIDKNGSLIGRQNTLYNEN
ncbi:hypothetical protein [Thermosipho sp. (in: thermotogales)]|jgi:hypothetical protein|uniref:hypothetical protein n=1 Tax=Thermosipho sp. (in: thermotogales) TaxID=1968895 RepID=UPI00257EB6D8|nr:hypothetical protein [Thermosipho sp. (in: thermotogales)]MBZ4649677.1 hypothetical protein [Thermosipho sp. (in: thermotogales)]